MGMQYTKIPEDTFQHLVLNAGILAASFTPASGTLGDLIGATTGGIQFSSNPTYEDFGEDVDNCPANTKELKRLTGYDPAMSGTFVTIDGDNVLSMVGAGEKTETTGVVKVVPSSTLQTSDFKDLWWIGDYSDKNSGTNAGFLAIHLLNTLNTSGFQFTSSKNGKVGFAFDFHGHVSMSDQDVVPFEIYLKEGTA